MRGYPKGQLSKRDFENLLAMPEYTKAAKADLVKLAAVDDDKISVSRGDENAPTIIEIANPLPTWKRRGFKDRKELSDLTATNIKDRSQQSPSFMT